ncbi:histidine--tRNA ligase [Anaerococcus sp. NML200537]|uniref:histidine--tRNA ligase n=1 Tax=Anaerococcus sp. NML200537 TaxID=2954485 RepID=UPI00223907EA|nr:histidine--tRNA ligase [Anaerococcus sp. NML200537]MCW6700475.1 histidine--tRNA ligase [Anaerococcus sp. NML200537]
MNIVRPSTIAGVMELLPEDQLVFDKMKNIIEETYKKYQFLPIDTPVIEKNEILFAKGGGETEKQIYEIASDTRDMSLRFDLTVPLARYVAEHFSDLNFPFKRYHIGKVYRGERNQKGRYREFYQCDIDIIGHNKLAIENDAIPPRVIYEIFQKLDTPDVSFRINNRKLLNGFFESLGIDDTTEVLRLIDKKDKMGLENMKEDLVKLLDEKSAEKIASFIEAANSNQETLEKFAGLVENDLYEEGLKELGTVYKYMIKLGIPDKNIKLDPSITRGLDYYTGTVYETFINGYEKIGSVSSGGRYEKLADNFTKQALPGVGMSIGLTRLFYQLKEIGLVDKKEENLTEILIIPMSEEENFYAIDILNILHDKGKNADIYLEGGKLKKKFSYADKIGVKYAYIIGGEERENKTITVRNMKTGEQENIEFENIKKGF